MADETPDEDINSPKLVAERLARFKEKQKRGDFAFRANVSANVRVALVRDKNGKPRFDGDPKKLPKDVQEEYRALMTPAEQKDIFG